MHCCLRRRDFPLQKLRRQDQYVFLCGTKPTYHLPSFPAGDTAEVECMCRATNAGTLIPTCEACVAQFPITDNDDNDRRDRDGDRDDVNGSFGSHHQPLSCVYLTKLCRCLRAPHSLQLLDYNVQPVKLHFSGYGASDKAWRGSGRSGRGVCDADW
jgi:hypothetical protein